MRAQNPFVETLYRYLERLEIIFLITAAASLLALYSGITPATTGLIISLSGLACVYFLYAYRPPSPQGDEKKDFASLLSHTILPKILGISCAVGTIGVLFYLLRLKGAQQMLMVHVGSGVIGLALFGLLALIKNSESQEPTQILYRAVPLLLICSYLLYEFVA